MISVSFLKSIYSRSETLKRVDDSVCDNIHVDLMDGMYAGEKNFTIDDIIGDLKDLKKPLDIHIMVNNPENYISDLAKLHPLRITFHLNTTESIKNVIDLIKEYNIEVGIAINPDEDIHLLDKYLGEIDYVLVMSVYPGKGGQEFMPEVLPKIEYLQDKNVLIGIDGGINDKTINYLKGYHIDNIISGSFVCMSDDYNREISKLTEDF